jgi:hypothetical protein
MLPNSSCVQRQFPCFLLPIEAYALSDRSGSTCSSSRLSSRLGSRLLLKRDGREVLLDTFIQRLQTQRLDEELVGSGLEAALLVGQSVLASYDEQC